MKCSAFRGRPGPNSKRSFSGVRVAVTETVVVDDSSEASGKD
jgi:hypothetical protein